MAKSPQKTAVVERKSTDVVEWGAFLKKAATKQAAAATALAGSNASVSFKAGVLQIGGAVIKGNKVDIIVLAVMQMRRYWEGEYDEKNPTSPDCYALGEVDGDEPEAPHEEAASPQCETCAECEFSQWGSSTRGTGRGQACRNTLELAFILANTKMTPEEANAQPVYRASVPPTSLPNMKMYMDEIGVQEANATFAWISTLSLEPSTKNVFSVNLERGNALPTQWRPAIMKHVNAAHKMLSAPLPKFEEEPEAKPAKGKPTGGKKRY